MVKECLYKLRAHNPKSFIIEEESQLQSIRVMVRAKYAESGKSYIGKHLEKMGCKTLFIVPQNMLKQDIECEAVTLNVFFGIGIDKTNSLPKYDYSGFDAIVFDEIYMSSPFILNEIRQFTLKNPHKLIIGAGDVKQLPSIEPYTNCQNIEDYVDNFIDIIFKHNIFLKICKRVGGKDTEAGERNRKKLDEIYDDLWIKDMKISDRVAKHLSLQLILW